MATRGACPRPGGRAGQSRPPITRAQMLRAAQTSAIVQKESAPAARGACPARSRTGIAKPGPPPPPPKRVSMAAPAMTKGMQMRQKAAEEKIRRMEAERKKAEAASCRRPRRTRAPVGGDARLGRQRSASPQKPAADQLKVTVLQEAITRGHAMAEKDAALDAAVARGHVTSQRPGAAPKRTLARPSMLRGPKPLASGTMIPEETKELARLMNAEVVQAVPISDGPVDKIIIDPGVIRSDRSTIVSISPEPVVAETSAAAAAGDVANRSIQAISETLDEQDAAESAAVQDKLQELQNARREFVIAVANVGGNSVNLQEGGDDSIVNVEDLGEPLEYIPSPPRERRVVRLPDVSHVMFQVEYGLDHPDVEAARKFSRRTGVALEQLQAQKRVEEEFERQTMQQVEDFDLEVPLEQDIQEGDISWEEDDQGNVMPCASRIKASMKIPRRAEIQTSYRQAAPDDIEKFFDLQNYPPPRQTSPRAPPGRENLNPDLWELEDPWWFEKQPADGCDLIRFD